jgi:ligand-binding sensor domain-containing protein
VLRNFGALDGLPSDRVWSAFEDRAGRIWFGTLGGGACCYDGESFATYRETGGLTRNHVQGIGQSADGALWFGFSGGLFRLAGEQLVNVTREGPWR